MGIKILAGFIAAVAVAVGGVYFAFSNESILNANSAPNDLPVSEGSCCSKTATGHCSDSATGSACGPDTFGACAGGMSVGATFAGPSACSKKSVSCCNE